MSKKCIDNLSPRSMLKCKLTPPYTIADSKPLKKYELKT